MEIRQLQIFLQVAAIQNFTKAGQTLGYSQSNISAQIRQLEEEIGAPLFNRIGRNITLTQYGEELLPYARQIVSTAVHMESFLKSEEALGGTLRVGMVESLFSPLAEQVLTAYHARFPRVDVVLTVDATETLKEHLRQGRLDLACLIDDPLGKGEWVCRRSLQVPVVIAAHPDDPLCRRESLHLRDLEQAQFIQMEATAPYSIHFQQALAEQQLAVRSFLTLQSAEAACRLVQSGQYLTVLPLYTVLPAARQGRIRVLPVEDFPLWQYVQIALHRNKVPTPQEEGFIDILSGALQRLVSGESEA
jgi:DNA-binding transcriptional LysR family regulator